MVPALVTMAVPSSFVNVNVVEPLVALIKYKVEFTYPVILPEPVNEPLMVTVCPTARLVVAQLNCPLIPVIETLLADVALTNAFCTMVVW